MTNITAPQFTDEAKAREYLENLRWPNGPVCPHCGSFGSSRLQGKKHRAGLIQCNDCREQYTVTVGTVFERSKVPLNKWLLCNHLLCASKKGMSAKQIERMLGVTYKTAWFMCHRIREAMKSNGGPMGGPHSIVEIDETFVGGKSENRAFRKTAKKKIVFSLVERDTLAGNGQVRSFHVTNVSAKTLRPLVMANVTRDTYLMSDGAPHYRKFGKEFADHGTSDHRHGKYVEKGGFVHSNTVTANLDNYEGGDPCIRTPIDDKWINRIKTMTKSLSVLNHDIWAFIQRAEPSSEPRSEPQAVNP